MLAIFPSSAKLHGVRRDFASILQDPSGVVLAYDGKIGSHHRWETGKCVECEFLRASTAMRDKLGNGRLSRSDDHGIILCGLRRGI